jgi:hypothetical protein
MHFLPCQNIRLEGSLPPFIGQPDGEPRQMQEYRTADRVFALGLLRRHVLDRLRDEPAADGFIGHGEKGSCIMRLKSFSFASIPHKTDQCALSAR